jgi:rhodanese-related sulfurtransferase
VLAFLGYKNTKLGKINFFDLETISKGMSLPFKNDADLIIPGIWLGNGKASMNDEFLKKNNITVVFNCTKDLPFHSSIKRRYRVPVDDNLQADEIRNLELWSYEIVYKIKKEHNKGRKILVHCYAGMQRSAASVAMYLIATNKMNSDEAITFLKDKRPIVFFPAPNFYDAILGFQKSYETNILPVLMGSTE